MQNICNIQLCQKLISTMHLMSNQQIMSKYDTELIRVMRFVPFSLFTAPAAGFNINVLTISVMIISHISDQ